ncbi:uncharacterized protein JN550_013206 [Neoarthrinium moseri]|uniref:uncharacterized protein n=1 Tax=Neoarthrinium moseri TaxID=1658444 RepID=UPI001FDDE414|nr:uncharacterized protein JN550_013206 [Neoarthrinium moseri]KAI1857388.1 hypothetical protein JN550_013206 [Neoarthrinium moseri]
MPSASAPKRSRRIAFDADDQDGLVVGEASSSLRGVSQGKRVRLSAGHKAGGPSRVREQSYETADDDDDDDDDSEEEDDQPMQEPTPEPALPAASQYEVQRDANFDHLNHAEEDDVRATQRLKSRPQLIGENHAALNAVIESIEVYNFMCHTRLKVELGPLLNFIVGENGSGKSAILTAITLCLGGKASSTNRGGSLKSFIKEGRDHGNLVVKIKNQGSDAYKPDLFGDSIIVERHFNRTGSSGFKLKSAAGKVISNKRDAVQDVVEYYCLQVDNPLNVLSQDNARQFLNSATPAVKYRYFLQGTQLEKLDQDLAIFHEMIDATEAKLNGYRDDFNHIKRSMEKAQALKETFAKTQDMRSKRKIYTRQLAWAQVVEQETMLQEKENNIAACDEAIRRSDDIVQQAAERLAKCDEMLSAAAEAAEELRQEGPDLEGKKEQAAEVYNKAKEAVLKVHHEEREVREQIRAADAEVRDFMAKITDEEKRLEAANGGAVAQHQKALDDAEQAVKRAEEEVDDHARKETELKKEFEEAEKVYQQAGRPLEAKRKEVDNVETRIRDLSQSKGDPLAHFIPQTRQLSKLIAQDTGFSQRPIGPLGLHIQLLRPSWSAMVEKVVGDNLDAYIVANAKDRARLSNHFDRLGVSKQPTIFISHPGRSIKTLNEPDERFDTILRVLKFDDNRVRDQLVLTNQIEQILLIEDLDDAWRVMTADQRPKNVKLSISLDANKRNGQGVSLKLGRGIDINQEPVYPSNKRRMKSDAEVQINHQKDILVQLQSDLKELDSSRRLLKQAAQKSSQSLTLHKSQAKKLGQGVIQARLRVEHAMTKLDEFDGADTRLQNLRDELRRAEDQKDHYGRQFGELSVGREGLNQASSAAKQGLSEAKKVCADFEARVQKAQHKIDRLKQSRSGVLIEINEAHDNLEVARDQKTRAERSRDAQQAQVEEFIAQASQVSPERVRIPEGETYASIEKKFEAVHKQLTEFEKKHNKSGKDIEDEAAATLERYEKVKKERKICEELVHDMKQALLQRLAKYRHFQRHISAAARANFEYLLSERGFRGKLLLDHVGKRLGIEVEPDQTRENVSGRNTKTLSGGEKSFSSICLLLAIWDAMGSPLRCLDEFDVFMDNVNRAISTRMLVQAARRSVGKQFILITPNAIEFQVKHDKDVKIIRLLDPRQTRLTDD